MVAYHFVRICTGIPWKAWGATVSIVLTAAATVWLSARFATRESVASTPASPAFSLASMLALPPSQLPEVDIATMNLLCAQGLPGAEECEVSACLGTLDAMARRVEAETARHQYRFRQNPAEFENSEGFFRMLMVMVVLAEDFGIRYNPERASPPTNANNGCDPAVYSSSRGHEAQRTETPEVRASSRRLPPFGGAAGSGDGFFADSRDVFLHGLLGPRRMGTCSSMPVLYVALGRRLGYPLKLVTTKGHLFARWEEARERFNLEVTGNGLNRFDDNYYRQWPFSITPAEEQAEGYLKSLTPAEELAVFLSIRAMCLSEAGRKGEAADAFAAASRLAPACRSYRAQQRALAFEVAANSQATRTIRPSTRKDTQT
jgi:hypothetical protein